VYFHLVHKTLCFLTEKAEIQKIVFERSKSHIAKQLLYIMETISLAYPCTDFYLVFEVALMNLHLNFQLLHVDGIENYD